MRPLLFSFAWSAIALTSATSAASDVPIDDLAVGYSYMRITDSKIGGRDVEALFLRHNLTVAAGIGDFSFGLELQQTDKGRATKPGDPETGLMLTLGHGSVLAEWLRWEGRARIALSPTNDSDQPLYGSDTDLLGKLVVFDVDGIGPPSNALFPSLSVGAIVNRFGRVQLLAGAGVWWSGFSVFATGLYAVNGIEDPGTATSSDRGIFAAIRNRAVTVSAGYDVDVSRGMQLHFEVRRNFAIENSGNDLVGAVTLRYFFDELEATP